tara:strand:+ start:3726 stop:4145 length:420 start_codon:yes stop_codon:yes gene_type:complete
VKKKRTVTIKDQKDWLAYIRNPKDLYDKEVDKKKTINKNKLKKIDLHGTSLDQANNIVKNFILTSYNQGYKKLLVITGKGLRSNVYNNPYISQKTSILKNSVPNFVFNDTELSDIVKRITKADLKDGGDGAIYIYLKKL